MATMPDSECPTGFEEPADREKVSQVTTKPLTHAFYIQPPRLHTSDGVSRHHERLAMRPEAFPHLGSSIYLATTPVKVEHVKKEL